MNTPAPFIFDSALIVRTLERDGDPWFVAKDIAAALGYTDTDNAVRMHCRKAETSPVESTGQVRHLTIIPESDVYRLIMRSNKPEAERFQDWICEEVIPSIRKTGSYVLAEGAERAMLLRETEETITKLQARRHVMALELRRLDKRRRRLGGETLALPRKPRIFAASTPGKPSTLYGRDDILSNIPAEGLRVSDLQRAVKAATGMSKSRFYILWPPIRDSGEVAIFDGIVVRRTANSSPPTTLPPDGE